MLVGFICIFAIFLMVYFLQSFNGIVKSDGGETMSNSNNTIQENMQSTDPFIRTLYTELHDRVEEFEREGSTIEAFTFSDAILPIVVMVGIILFLLTSIY